jgi:LysM repeat protein
MTATIRLQPADQQFFGSSARLDRSGGRRIVTEATYRRRRALVGTALAVVVACGAVITHDVLAGSGGVPASAAESQPAHARPTVTAQPGDTLWSIARAHRGEVPIDRFVDKLVDLNGGPSIQAGQQVVLP